VATATDSSELDFLALTASRDIATLPGGPLQLGVGLDYTHHAVHAAPAAGVQQGLYNLAGNTAGIDAFAVGEQDIAAAYLELDAQLLKNLEVDLAGRMDHVNTYGTSTTPKFGIKYTPLAQLSLRGTYSQGFRAPNPAESGNAGAAFFYTSVQDPVLCGGGKTAVGSFPSQCSVVPTFFQGANHQLKPEKSDSFTLGLVFEPMADFSLAADYYRIRLRDQITSSINAFPVSQLVTSAVRGSAGQVLPQVIDSSGTIANRPIPAGLILYIPTPYLNAPTIQTDGVDINLRTRFKLSDFGTLSSDLNISHMFHYKLSVAGTTVDLAGTHGPSGIGGDTGTPQTRATWTWTWDRGPMQVAATASYISSFNVTDPASGLPDCQSAIQFNGNGSFTSGQTVSPGVCTVASFTTFDFTGRYVIDKQWTVRAAVVNAFNRQAPLDLQTYGGSNYNPSLHQAGAVGRFLQVGATYDF
jgi:iron complex outermembrane receptor protein